MKLIQLQRLITSRYEYTYIPKHMWREGQPITEASASWCDRKALACWYRWRYR